MPKAFGFIPDKVTYVCAPEREVLVGCKWDISYYEQDKNIREKVLPAFPVDSSNEKTMKTAIAWASQPGYKYVNGQHTTITNTHTSYETENKPIKNVRVLSLEERGNGGRAYKVMIGKYYVDLREDVLMDVLLQTGVSPGGILNGEFIWAKIGTSMKLIRIDSELYGMIAESHAKKDLKPLSKTDLEIGGVYQDKKKNTAIFIGYINTTVFKEEPNTNNWNNRTKPTFNYEQTPIKKAMLFYKVYDFDGIEKSVKEMKTKDSTYQFEIKRSHTFIEKIKTVELPDDIVASLREKAVKDVKGYLLEFTGHKEPRKGYAKLDDWTLSRNIAYHSDHINMYVYGGKPVELFDVKKYLLFS